MAQPTPYLQTTDFSNDEGNNVGGRSTVRTAMLDAELAAIALTIGQIRTNLSILQRDDTKVRDGFIELYNLSATARAALQLDFNPRGAWATATAYAVDDLVEQDNVSYLCLVAHTSGTFATDYTAAKWMVFTGGGAVSLADYAALRAYTGPAATVQVTGYLVTAAPSGIAGAFTRDDADTTTADNGGTIIVATNGKRWKRVYSGLPNVKWFGAKGDGSTDDTTAIVAAHATGFPVFYPAVTDAYICNQQIDLTQGGMIGESYGTVGGAKRSMIRFGGGISTRGALITKIDTQVGRPRISDMFLGAASWDVSTGVRCNGLDIEAPVYIDNVTVSGFYGHGAFFHNDANGNGPYESWVRNLKAQYSRQHGILVGTGANVITFVNPEGKWNGAPAFNTAPTVAGSYDGFYVDVDGDANPAGAYLSYTPEGLTVIGGDASYNSRYGWNFDALRNSTSVFPAYAEGNLVGSSKQVRIGADVQTTTISFAVVANGLAGLQNDATFTSYHPTLRVTIAGRRVIFGGINYDLREDAGGSQSIRLTQNGSDLTLLLQNGTPDGTAIASSGYGSVTTLYGGGSYAWGLGSGSHHMNIAANDIRLPQTYYRKTSTGWGSATQLRTMSSAMPTSGSYTAGAFVENSNKQVLGSAGSYYTIFGWNRLTTGSAHVLNTDWVECRCPTGA